MVPAPGRSLALPGFSLALLLAGAACTQGTSGTGDGTEDLDAGVTASSSSGGVSSSSSSSSSSTSSSSGSSTTSLPPAGPVRVMTFNVERLFDATCNTGNCGSGQFEPTRTQAQVDSHVQQLVRAIRTRNPDILMVQEVETEPMMQQLRASLDGGYNAVAFGEIGGPASLDVGLVARATLLSVRRHRAATPLMRADGGTTTFSREFLEVHLERDGRLIIAFVAHFRSKANDDPERRYLEAQAARRIVTERATEFPDALIIMGGDLNDTPGSVPINTLLSGNALHRVASVLGNNDDGDATYYFNNNPEAIDHLLVPAALQPRVVPGSVAVERDVAGSQGGLGGSDHAALRASFELEP